jgi:glycosyltransferase involved in cell wall biosynthesis
VVTTLPALAAQGIGPLRLEPGIHLLAVPTNDPRALAGALERLAADPALAARLGEAGRLLAQRCSWESIARETVEVYRGCWAKP